MVWEKYHVFFKGDGVAITKEQIETLSKLLDAAYQDHREITMFTPDYPQIDIADAYSIQENISQKCVQRGEKIIGMKMGLTSKAKMKQMKVENPIYGFLTDSMMITDNSVSLSSLIHPKIEPEIAFFIDKDLQGNVSEEQVLDSCSRVCSALEIIDSRFKDFQFTLIDVVADNCSSAKFILGNVMQNPKKIDVGNLGMIMKPSNTDPLYASSSAIYGNPVSSVVTLVQMLSLRNQTLKAGTIVLAGGATQAIPLVKDQIIELEVQELGSFSLHVID